MLALCRQKKKIATGPHNKFNDLNCMTWSQKNQKRELKKKGGKGEGRGEQGGEREDHFKDMKFICTDKGIYW